MKRITLLLSGIVALLGIVQEASALPAFARQTGMPCTACHQQHFPVLNSFGQAFKASGYTIMGAQTPVEDEHLSIPPVLNAAILFKGRYQKTDGTGTGINDGTGTTTNDGQWQFGDEFSVFFGGRVAENAGFLFEGNVGGTAATGNTTNTSALVAGIKLPFMYDVKDAKVGLIPFSTDTLGVAYGFELASTGAVRNIRWAENRNDISAQQYVGTGNSAASGVALVAKNEMGYVNYSRWSPNHLPGSNGGNTPSTGYKSNYLRVAVSPTLNNWEILTGIQLWNGTSEVLGTGTTGVVDSALKKTQAQALDLQAFGKAGENDLAIYVTYAKANASKAGAVANLFNSGPYDRKAFTLGADYSVIPHALHVGAAYRSADDGGSTTSPNGKDNSITVMAVYDVDQNVALHINHSMHSGSSYDAGGVNDATVAPNSGKNLTTLLLEMAW